MAVYPEGACVCDREFVSEAVAGRDGARKKIWLIYEIKEKTDGIRVPLGHHTSTIHVVCTVILVDTVCMNDGDFIKVVVEVYDEGIIDSEFDRFRAVRWKKKRSEILCLTSKKKYVTAIDCWYWWLCVQTDHRGLHSYTVDPNRRRLFLQIPTRTKTASREKASFEGGKREREKKERN